MGTLYCWVVRCSPSQTMPRDESEVPLGGNKLSARQMVLCPAGHQEGRAGNTAHPDG